MTVQCTRCGKTFASDSPDPGESVAFDMHTCSNPVLEPRPGEPFKDYVERQRLHDLDSGLKDLTPGLDSDKVEHDDKHHDK